LPESFVRVHKSCIINPCLIIQKNKTHIRMSDGAEVEVSRRKRRMTESVIG
jgi:DNA-binding LytR/AlgR family response regulator